MKITTERLTAATRETESRDVARLRGEDGQRVTLAAPAQGSERRAFTMLGYSGAEIQRWYGRLAIDVQGIEADESVAILYEHNDLRPVAVATKVERTPEGLMLSGHMLSNATAKEIAANADEGLPYKCSVGVRILQTEELAEGAEIQLNGRVMKGPLTIAKRSRLFECSFITCDPADPNTSAEVMHREGQMADLKDAPASTELLRAEAEKLARAELAKRAEELRAAFPDRVDFANDCALKGMTVVEAKASLADRLTTELKAERESKKTTTDELEKLKKAGRVPGLGFAGQQRETLVAEVADYSPVERAKAEWHGQPVVRAAFPDYPGAQYSGVERYAAWLRLEERLKVEPTAASAGFGGHGKALAVLKRAAEVLEPSIRASGMSERLSSWGKSGPDYADYTVKGYLGMLYRPLEDILGLSWGPRLGVMIPSNQETETYRFFGQVPQLREWLGSRQYAPLAKYSFNVTNKLYEASLLVAVADFLFEKSGQLQIRFGELGRRAGQHWEKLVSTLITANGTAYDGVAFFSASHTLGGSSGTMNNTLAAAQVNALNVSVPSDPTPEEFAKALVGVTAKFYGFLDDKGEPINGDARKFVLMVPTNLWPAALAAVRLNRLNSGSENLVKVQEITWDVVCNPRLDSNSAVKFYVFREDSMFKPFVLQEATGVELEFQGAGSPLAFEQDAYAFGLKVRRAAAYGEWAHAIEATFS